MIDISTIEKYIIPIEPFDERLIDDRISNEGVELVYNSYLKRLDCTRIVQGIRMQQTIGYVYMVDMSNVLYIIQTYYTEQLDKKLQELLNIHNRNLEFETLNPPVWYGGDKTKKKFEKAFGKKSKSSHKVKQTKVKYDENGEPIKSAAERKLALRVGKINALSFKLK